MTRKVEVIITKGDLLAFAAENGCLSGLDGNEWSIVVHGEEHIVFSPDESDSIEVLRMVAVHEGS